MSVSTMPRNFQVYFGPPGTGKTTTLSAIAKQYADEDGPESLLLTSFTKAAAQELAGRDLPVATGGIGTLHSHCYSGLDHPTIAESKVIEWNADFPRYPMSKMSPGLHDASGTERQGILDEHDMHHAALLGDTCLAEYNIARAALRPPSSWEPGITVFARQWEDWKAQHAYLDFTDLLIQGRTRLRIAPGNPKTIIVDEAQDLTPLQWSLIAGWSQHAQQTIAGGDDDQCLYTHIGADPSPLLHADQAVKHVLPQSYRLPRTIYTYAQRYLQAIHRREPKQWTPNGQEGKCLPGWYAWHHPDSLREVIDQTLEEPWGTLMVLAPCSYMLTDLVTMLRADGVPFANPWRRRRGDWNPLHYAGKGVASVTRLLDFLRPLDRLWTGRELASWVKVVRQRGNLTEAAPTLLALHEDEDHVVSLDLLRQIFLPDALPNALAGDIRWFMSRILKKFAHGMAFPLRVYARYGQAGLADDPRIHVGTCHSVKGGEADRVVLFTELSRGFQHARALGGDTADAVERMLYVGATRAREELYVV